MPKTKRRKSTKERLMPFRQQVARIKQYLSNCGISARIGEIEDYMSPDLHYDENKTAVLEVFGMRLRRPIVVYATTGTLEFSSEITISSSFTAECAKNAEASETLRGKKGFSHYSTQNSKWLLNYSFYPLYILFFHCNKDNR